jgi:uncharacterized membrane protein YidH (DUF202 family)
MKNAHTKNKIVGTVLAVFGVGLMTIGALSYQVASADALVAERADWVAILIAGGLILVIAGIVMMVSFFLID